MSLSVFSRSVSVELVNLCGKVVKIFSDFESQIKKQKNLHIQHTQRIPSRIAILSFTCVPFNTPIIVR